MSRHYFKLKISIKNIIITLLLVAAITACFFWLKVDNAIPANKVDVVQPIQPQPIVQQPVIASPKSTTDFDTHPDEVITIIPYNQSDVYVYKGKFNNNRVMISIDKNNTLKDYLAIEKENLGTDKIKVMIKPAKNCSSKNVQSIMSDISGNTLASYGMDGISKDEQAFIDRLAKNN